METLAWIVALCGLLLGAVAAFVPGFPGSAVALLGVVSFAALTEFAVVTREALVLATLIALGGALTQLAAPVVTSRAAGGTAGAATGAAIGAALGSLVPVPGIAWLGAVIGAMGLGLLASREGIVRTARGIVGAVGGCAVAVAADFVAVMGVGAVLAVAAFAARLRP